MKHREKDDKKEKKKITDRERGEIETLEREYRERDRD